MLTRTLRPLSRPNALPRIFRASYVHPSAPSNKSVNQVPANDPNPRTPKPNVSASNDLATSSEGSSDKAIQESPVQAEELRTLQAPNRKGIWSRSQQPREVAMRGPRFEQASFEDQPRPYAAIDLIHKQPVSWVKERIVACDGGGGPLGHPRVFINTDKPQIAWCEYCGSPYANEHHRAHLESLPSTSYPLEPQGHPAEVSGPQKLTDEPLAQR